MMCEANLMQMDCREQFGEEFAELLLLQQRVKNSRKKRMEYEEETDYEETEFSDIEC